jgi:hypothetical protein
MVSLSVSSLNPGQTTVATVKVTKGLSEAIAGVTVNCWFMISGGSKVDLGNKVTNSSGVATFTIPAQTTPGEYTVYGVVPDQTLSGAPVTTNWNQAKFSVASPTPLATTMTLSPSVASINIGGQSNLSGILKTTSGTALVGKTVKLYITRPGTSTETLLSSATTASNGSFSINVSAGTFSQAGTFKFRAVYEGSTSDNVTYSGCASGSVNVTVTAVNNTVTTQISAHGPTDTPTVGTQYNLSAHIAQGATSLGNLTLVLVNKTGGATIATAVSDGYGNVGFKITPSAVGSYAFTVKFDGKTVEGTTYTASSTDVTITVAEAPKPALATSINVSSFETPALSKAVKVAGWAFTGSGAVPAGMKIQLVCSGPAGTNTLNTTTNSSGSFNFDIPASFHNKAGSYVTTVRMTESPVTINAQAYYRYEDYQYRGEYTVAAECISGQAETEYCADGSTIIKKNCVNDVWVASANQCPAVECTTPLYVDCADGTKVLTKDCVSGKYYPTNVSCPGVISDECTQDMLETCPDGTTIIYKKCTSGKYVATGNECTTTPSGGWTPGYYLKQLLSKIGV